MLIAKLISIINIGAWLIPPVRQYRGEYFYYFLILALTDPIALTLNRVIGLDTLNVYIILTILMALSLFFLKPHNKSIIAVAIGIFIGYLLANYATYNEIIFALALIHTFILFVFIKRGVVSINELGAINFYYFMLILYEISIVMKFVVLIANINAGVFYYHLTTFFQILIAIYFSIYRINTSPKVVIIRQVKL